MLNRLGVGLGSASVREGTERYSKKKQTKMYKNEPSERRKSEEAKKKKKKKKGQRNPPYSVTPPTSLLLLHFAPAIQTKSQCCKHVVPNHPLSQSEAEFFFFFF